MSTFQPEKPHGESKETKGRASVLVFAVLGAIVAGMAAIFVLPLALAVEGISWWIVLGVSVATFLIILVAGFTGSENEHETQQEQETQRSVPR